MEFERQAVELARRLISLDSTSDHGTEERCATLLGQLLEDAGFRVRYFHFAVGRTGLVAELGNGRDRPICLTGHLDTVSLGGRPWSVDPLAAEVRDGRLFGRGACDMKAGVAALVMGVLSCRELLRDHGGVMLVLTAGEETGCQGAAEMIRSGLDMRRAGAILVAEPTENLPLLGHKGALWLKMVLAGKGAHGSMPEQGDNALLKGAYLATRLDTFRFATASHRTLGLPSLNVGTFKAGTSPNMVPDRAELEVDIRSTPGMRHDEIVADLSRHLEPADYSVERLLDLPGIWTDAADPWVSSLFARLAERNGHPCEVRGASYFTDCCILGPASGGAPVVVLGPGDPKMAHQTDEYCETSQIEEAVAIYHDLLRDWCSDHRQPLPDDPPGRVLLTAEAR